MELSVSGRQRRAAQITTAAPLAEKKTVSSGTTAVKFKSDRTSWSQVALSYLQELNQQDLEKQRKLLEQKQKGNSELDYLNKALKAMDKCQKIASRIMKGDKVPPQDEQYLRDNDPDGYKLALACRVPKEKPKEWKSVLEDEDQTGGDSSGSGGEDGGEAVPED